MNILDIIDFSSAFREMPPEQQHNQLMAYLAKKPRPHWYRVVFDDGLESSIAIALTDEEANYVRMRLAELCEECGMVAENNVFDHLFEYRGMDRRLDELVIDKCYENLPIGTEDEVELDTIYLDTAHYIYDFTVIPIFPDGDPKNFMKPYKYGISLTDEEYATLLQARILDSRFCYNWLILTHPELAMKITRAVCFPGMAEPDKIDYRSARCHTLFTVLFDEIESDFINMVKLTHD